MAVDKEKVTVSSFKAKLNDGHYNGIAGARRAISRLKWSDEERAQASKLADKHFDAEPLSAEPKEKKEKAKKEKKFAKKAGAKKEKTAKVAKPKAEAKVKRKYTKRAVAADAEAQPEVEVKKTRAKKSAIISAVGTTLSSIKADKLEEANNTNTAIRETLLNYERALRLGGPSSEAAQGAKRATMVLNKVVEDLCSLTDIALTSASPTEAELKGAEVFAKAARSSRPGNGVGAQPLAPVDEDSAQAQV